MASTATKTRYMPHRRPRPVCATGLYQPVAQTRDQCATPQHGARGDRPNGGDHAAPGTQLRPRRAGCDLAVVMSMSPGSVSRRRPWPGSRRLVWSGWRPALESWAGATPVGPGSSNGRAKKGPQVAEGRGRRLLEGLPRRVAGYAAAPKANAHKPRASEARPQEARNRMPGRTSLILTAASSTPLHVGPLTEWRW
jgi:hypothetical protein